MPIMAWICKEELNKLTRHILKARKETEVPSIRERELPQQACPQSEKQLAL